MQTSAAITKDCSIATKVGRFRNPMGRLWRARRQYLTTRDWLLSFYHRVLLYLPWLPLPGRNAIRQVRLREMREPLQVRLGTTDWYVLEEVFLDRIYQPVIERRLRNVRHVLDLGANTGFTIRLWQTVYPAARIVAVEPDAANLQMCSYNALTDSQLDRLKLIQACVAGRARAVSLDRSGGAWRFSMRDQVDSTVESLPAMTIPQILEACAIDGPIDLLKCDIEGSEMEVFADCRGWIGRVKNLIVELHQPYSSEQFCADLRRAGGLFDIYYQVSSNESELLFLEQIEG